MNVDPDDSDQGIIALVSADGRWSDMADEDRGAGVDLAMPPLLSIGVRLRRSPEDQVFALKVRIAELEERAARLESHNSLAAADRKGIIEVVRECPNNIDSAG